MRAKLAFKFDNEIKQTKETKIPKSKIEYKRLQPKAVGQSKETQTGTVDSGFTLGEAPANTYAPTTYSPLVQQLPELVSPSIASSYNIPIVTRSLETQTLPLGNPIIEEHPDFYKTFTGIQAYEKAQAEEAISQISRERDQAVAEKNLSQEFIDTFFYDKFKVPIEMREELRLILPLLKNVELDNGKLRKDSAYNQDVFDSLTDWMDKAVAAGNQRRNFKIQDLTDFLGIRRLRLNQRAPALISKKSKERMKQLREDLAETSLNLPPVKIPRSIQERRGAAGDMDVDLRVNTNIPQKRGPLAPTKATFPQLNKANVSTANIVGGSRRRRRR